VTNRTIAVMMTVLLCAAVTAVAQDTFGTGPNQFTIEFVTISGDASIANGMNISQYSPGEPAYKAFADPGSDYRMGVFEITNDQWDKFKTELGAPVTGDPSSAYDMSSFWTDTNAPVQYVSWYEAAQFVNWLNTSTGHHAAYKFTGTQGDSGYALDIWSAAEADGGTNVYRHKDAFYFMPSEDEWVKAAYWNGTALQQHAIKAGDTLHQGDGNSGTGWNYYTDESATSHNGPWDIGSGSEELNGTFDMMGNVWEWTEGPWSDADYGMATAPRGHRGGAYSSNILRYPDILGSSYRTGLPAYVDSVYIGFRVASEIPEPATIGLLAAGGLALLRRRK
jgi:formylglycine-generating enzyme required for sulfatase activity